MAHLSVISTFGSGLKELNLISKYYKVPKNENINK
jgi:hypothetical protein